MEQTVIDIISSTGYLGIALLIFIENIFPPIPSEVVLMFGGFAVTHAGLNPWLVILAATVGSLAGAVALYLIGRAFGKERLKRLLSGKLGKILRFTPESVEKADTWFCKYRYRAVFLCRCVPVVRSVISVPAGTSKMPLAPFFSLTILGSLIWNTGLVWLGVAAGNAWEKTAAYFGKFSKIILIVFIAVPLIIYLIRKRKKSKKSKNTA